MIYINNFNSSRNLSELIYQFIEFKSTNINGLLKDFEDGETEWSVPKTTNPGDIVIFMCANSAYKNLSAAVSHTPPDCSQDFLDFVAEQKALYLKHSGFLLGCGIVKSMPYYDDDGRWYAIIDQLQKFDNPVCYDDFKSFIALNKFGSITVLKDEQWKRLQWLIHRLNPELFADCVAPNSETLECEFKEAVKKEESKPLEQLKKEAEKKKSKPSSDTVSTKIFYRNPTIAAYVKKRADGYCQLCGIKAPFTVKNGEPYLESHHIEWLSKGGMDSADNCVALCPNCHRKMHILNDSNDIKKLKLSIK